MIPNKGQHIFQDIGSNKVIMETSYLPFLQDKGIKGLCALKYTNSFHEKYVKNFENFRENSRPNKGKSKVP